MTRPPYAKHGGRKLAVAEKCPCDTCTAYRTEHRRKQSEQARIRYGRNPNTNYKPRTTELAPCVRCNGPRVPSEGGRGLCRRCYDWARLSHQLDKYAPQTASRRQPLIDAGLASIAHQQWRDDALCTQTDPETFFPEKGGTTAGAKRVCNRCPVQAQRLEYALANHEGFGVWGGLSERERREIARGRVA